jgi:flagellin-like protein
MQKKAEMGIGTLIIFIAMILVAAIAAGVLIQTATSLQNKALLTGERSKSQVSTSITPMLVYAEDGSSGHDVDTFFMKLKLIPGSDPIRLSDTLLEVSMSNTSNDYIFNATSNCSVVPSAASGYAAEYLITGSSYSPGYLQRGDVLKLCFKTSRNVIEDETISITLIPKVGSPTMVETAMPDIITETRVSIFP